MRKKEATIAWTAHCDTTSVSLEKQAASHFSFHSLLNCSSKLSPAENVSAAVQATDWTGGDNTLCVCEGNSFTQIKLAARQKTCQRLPFVSIFGELDGGDD